MKNVYGYIRVSTKEQIDGASLPEQKRAIKEYAKKNNLNIIHFYEETKTAAKRGRPFFLEMIENLHQGKADGVIIHKIDRSARNLHDWASIGDLIDRGIEVFFAHESLNMNERGGRLSADIQAVMASDYVRNLKQEIRKGLDGRLKQGIYPWKAPIGYIDMGGGKLKEIDTIQVELIRQLFELYATGNYTILELTKKMKHLGLKNTLNNNVSKNAITRILKNPFYIGLIKIKGKVYNGKHNAIVDVNTFKRVQMVFEGRGKYKKIKHHHLYRKKVRCENCRLIMSGELQKGNVYYRCKTKSCPTKTIREDTITKYFRNILKAISLTYKEKENLKTLISEAKESALITQKEIIQSYKLQLIKIENREQKIFDAYLDNLINKEEYERRKQNSVFKQKEIQEIIDKVSLSDKELFNNIENLVELCESPLKTYELGIQEEKIELLGIVTSNLTISGRKALFTMVSPFNELANRDIFLSSGVYGESNRTLTPKIIYSDKNTSPIIPKPLNRKQLKEFFHFLLKTATALNIPNLNKHHYEISKDDTCS